MSLKTDLTLALAKALGPWLIKAQGRTWLIRYNRPSYFYLRREGDARRVIYSFWHRDILVLGYFARNQGIRVLISEHKDGELIARVVQQMGFSIFRGSTTRGGVKALKSLERVREDPSECDLAFTPDGPKGPARRVQKGVVYAAAKTGFPIVPVSVAVSRCWEMRSWDRFRIPKPFSRCFVYLGEEMPVPPDVEGDGIEEARARLEERMIDTERLAEAALKNGI